MFDDDFAVAFQSGEVIGLIPFFQFGNIRKKEMDLIIGVRDVEPVKAFF